MSRKHRQTTDIRFRNFSLLYFLTPKKEKFPLPNPAVIIRPIVPLTKWVLISKVLIINNGRDFGYLNDIQNVAPIVAPFWISCADTSAAILCAASPAKRDRDTSDISGYPKFPFGNPAGFPRKTSDYPRALGEINFSAHKYERRI